MENLKVFFDLVASLAWPAVAVFAMLYFKAPIASLLGRLKNANLPGGVHLDFDKQLNEARDIADDISSNPDKRLADYTKISATVANNLLLERGLRPSPSGLEFQTYKVMVAEDPILALASLRTEVDAMVKNLADGFDIEIDSQSSAAALLGKLHREGAIYSRQYELGRKVIELCDAAIHGIPVTRVEADAVIDIATVLASEYLDWLGWGFPDQMQAEGSLPK